MSSILVGQVFDVMFIFKQDRILYFHSQKGRPISHVVHDNPGNGAQCGISVIFYSVGATGTRRNTLAKNPLLLIPGVSDSLGFALPEWLQKPAKAFNRSISAKFGMSARLCMGISPSFVLSLAMVYMVSGR